MKDLTLQQNEEIGLLKKSGNLDAIPAVIEKYKALMEVYQVPKPLMYLEGAGADEYLADMYAAQEFALLNRQRDVEGHCRILELGLPSTGEIHNHS